MAPRTRSRKAFPGEPAEADHPPATAPPALPSSAAASRTPLVGRGSRAVMAPRTRSRMALSGEPADADPPPVTAGPSPAPTTEDPASVIAAVGTDMTKAPAGERAYRRFELRNGFNCIVVTDPETPMAAAALTIGAGYFNDPPELEGLSHLLQLQVFNGSGNEDLLKHVAQNGGACNLCTSSGRTTFSFHVNPDAITSSLDRLALMLAKPFRYTDEISKGKNIISVMDGQEDNPSEMTELHKHLTSQSHPYHKFSKDNWKTVEANAVKKGLNVADELEKLHASSYSPRMMSLAVYGKESLIEMQKIIESKFSMLTNSQGNPLPSMGHPCTSDCCQILIKAAPMKDQMLKMQWPVTCESCEEISACKYVMRVISSKEEGSIFYILKKLGWCSDLKAEAEDGLFELSFFSIVISLTDLGKDHFEEISGVIFNYIKMLRRQGPRSYIFKEIKNNCEARFTNEENSPMNHVVNISTNLKFFSMGEGFIGSSIPLKYSKDAVKSMVNKLVLENVRIFWASAIFKEKANFTEPIYDTPYHIECLSQPIIKQWMAVAPKELVLLPKQVSVALTKPALESAKDLHAVDGTTSANVRLDMLNPVASKSIINSLPRNLSSEGQSLKQACIIYDERMLLHVPPTDKHNENPRRISAIYERLESDGLLDRCNEYDSEFATEPHMKAVHNTAYLKRILAQAEGKEEMKKTNETASSTEVQDMYLSTHSGDAIKLAAGGAIKACRLVALGQHQYAFAIVRPPGHHAKHEEEGGFCYLNNIATAAKSLINEHGKKRILILDWDVHFGDGTYEIFDADSRVLFISMHRRDIFPKNRSKSENRIGTGDGRGFSCNICWEKGVDDDDLFAALEHVIFPLASEFQPEMILISGGFDAAAGDPLGGCYLTHTGYATTLYKLLELGTGVVIVLEGGYNIETLAQCCSSCVKVLCGDLSDVKIVNEYHPLPSTWASIVKVRRLLKPYWRCFELNVPDTFLSRSRKEPDKRRLGHKN